MLYRIFTENRNLKKVESVISKHFEGFTLIKAKGFWWLQKENSLIIEIITANTDKIINALAKEIKAINNQDAVLVQKIKNNQWLI